MSSLSLSIYLYLSIYLSISISLFQKYNILAKFIIRTSLHDWTNIISEPLQVIN